VKNDLSGILGKKCLINHGVLGKFAWGVVDDVVPGECNQRVQSTHPKPKTGIMAGARGHEAEMAVPVALEDSILNVPPESPNPLPHSLKARAPAGMVPAAEFLQRRIPPHYPG